MAKGYPIGPPLQTMQGAEISIIHRHMETWNCGEIAVVPATCSAVLTMNSVAEHALTD
jgi:hypothetical protein